MTIEFFVPGIPAPKGSHRAFAKGGRAWVTSDNPKTAVPWASAITTIATHYRPPYLWLGPVNLEAIFYMPPPKGLPRTTYSWPTKKPDLDKLVRLLKDCLSGVFYRDDAQVHFIRATKLYSLAPGVHVKLMGEEDFQFGYRPPRKGESP